MEIYFVVDYTECGTTQQLKSPKRKRNKKAKNCWIYRIYPQVKEGECSKGSGGISVLCKPEGEDRWEFLLHNRSGQIAANGTTACFWTCSHEGPHVTTSLVSGIPDGLHGGKWPRGGPPGKDFIPLVPWKYISAMWQLALRIYICGCYPLCCCIFYFV